MAAYDKAFLARKILSSDGPKTEEINHEPSLLAWCATRIEPEEQSDRRRRVLERINNTVRVWIRQTMITEFRMPESDANQVEGRIFATGSYRYNVHTAGSDIDMVLIAPNRITLHHFFGTLAARLKSEPWVSELHSITDSHVPIIAMVCDGIDIDLSFGSIRQDRVPEVITDDLLQGLDEQSVRSCNAVRVAHDIMDLVPNKAVFRQTLRFVKAWGKERGVYSNTFGFPSGIGWAILCAFVCQCYPNQNAAGMVSRFFRTYHAWFKPNPHETGSENRAIYLTESMRAKSHIAGSWDPRTSKRDATALFPVLTPALPYGNACYNVTLTNLRQLCDEFKRGHELISSYLSMSSESAKEAFGPFGVWSKLLEPVAFFGEYKHYLQLRISCSDPELYQAYVDGVESQVRKLWSGKPGDITQLEDMRHLRLHINPHRFEDPEEVAQRAQLLDKRSRQQQQQQQQLQQQPSSTRTSMGGGGINTPQRGSTHFQPQQQPPQQQQSTQKYSAYYYIGMTVDTSISSAPIRLGPSINQFHTAVKALRQYRPGVTELPVITVCDMSKIAQYVKDAAGYMEAAPASVAAPSLTAGDHTGAASAGSSSAASHAGGGASVSGTSGASRSEGAAATDSSSHSAFAAGIGVGVGIAPGKRAREEDAEVTVEKDNSGDELEQALGLDF